MNYEIESIIYSIGLEKLKKKGEKFNFRCYICKDSKTNQRKTRGWISDRNGKIWYHCFNCGASMPFHVFLKEHCYHVYGEYVKTVLLKLKQVAVKKEVQEFKRVELEKIDDLPSIMSLDPEHPARKYLSDRQIPFKYFDNMYYAHNYQMWINKKIPNKFIKTPRDDNRIVLPIYNTFNKIVGVQGRAIMKTNLRYITILFNENELNVSGLEKLNKNETIYVTEGFIDSLFLPNAISINSADVKLDRLLEIASKDKFIFVYDNERRNDDIKYRMIQVAKAGFKVIIWPESVYHYGKDINKMIQNGYKISEILDIINSNVHSGFSAEIKIRIN